MPARASPDQWSVTTPHVSLTSPAPAAGKYSSSLNLSRRTHRRQCRQGRAGQGRTGHTVKSLQRKCFVLRRILSIRNSKQLYVTYKGFSLYCKGFPSYYKLKFFLTLRSILVCNMKHYVIFFVIQRNSIVLFRGKLCTGRKWHQFEET